MKLKSTPAIADGLTRETILASGERLAALIDQVGHALAEGTAGELATRMLDSLLDFSLFGIFGISFHTEGSAALVKMDEDTAELVRGQFALQPFAA
jgi:hypothetical protein